MTHTMQALEIGDVTGLGIGITIALVVIGVLLFLLIAKLVARVIIVIVVVVLGFFVWQQRNHVQDAFASNPCDKQISYFGVTLELPAKAKDTCMTLNN